MEQNFTLGGVISIEDALLMLDDATPHVAIPAQAVRDRKVIATKLSDEYEYYQFTSLNPGRHISHADPSTS